MTYRKDPPTTDSFPKAGDDEADVVNRSGERPAGVYWVDHPRPASEAPTGGPTSHRAAIQVDAQTSEQLDAAMATRAERMWSESVDRHGSPHTRGYLRHVLGVIHPGRHH
jgi:hypothetical protein